MPHTETLAPMPSVSIVMPSYNRRDQLVRALTYIAAQTYPADLVEMVLVLDGCTDGSAAAVEKLRPTFPFALTLIEQPQSGPAAARNTGVRAAKSECIVFLDDDVMAQPDLLMNHWRIFRSNPNTVIVGPMATPTDHIRPIWVRWEEYILTKQYADILAGKYSVTPRQFYTGNCWLKRSWIVDAGLFDETFKRYEDVELAYRIHHLGVEFAFNPTAIGYHYANRTFASWTRAHDLYGHYAARMARDKGYTDVYDYIYWEFRKRNIITRFLSVRLVGRKRLLRLTTGLLLLLAQAASVVRHEHWGYRGLSCLANILFWQGFKTELNSH